MARAAQLPMFPEAPDADEALNEAQAALRVEQFARADSRPSRDEQRSRRKRVVRARTVSMKRMTKRELELGRLLYPVDEHEEVVRPRTRADCADGERPCPFVSCKHHLYLDVAAKTGAIKLNFPDLEPDELAESCALDVADRHGATLEEVGAHMNMTRERIRQVEVKALAKCQASEDMFALRDFVEEEGPRGKRKLPVLQASEPEDEDDSPQSEAGFDVDHFASDELEAE